MHVCSWGGLHERRRKGGESVSAWIELFLRDPEVASSNPGSSSILQRERKIELVIS